MDAPVKRCERFIVAEIRIGKSRQKKTSKEMIRHARYDTT